MTAKKLYSSDNQSHIYDSTINDYLNVLCPILQYDIEYNMHKQAPIIQLLHDLYAFRTWTSLGFDKIKYDHGYILLAKTENGWSCSTCHDPDRCIHLPLFSQIQQNRIWHNLQAESDSHVPIYKPGPTKSNIYLCAHWSQWMSYSSSAPDIAMICVKTSAKKIANRLMPTCEKCSGKTNCLHLDAFGRSTFYKKLFVTDTQSESQHILPEVDVAVENSSLNCSRSSTVPLIEHDAVSKENILLPYNFSELAMHKSHFMDIVTRKLTTFILEYYDYAHCKHENGFQSGEPREEWQLGHGSGKNPTVLVTILANHNVQVYF